MAPCVESKQDVKAQSESKLCKRKRTDLCSLIFMGRRLDGKEEEAMEGKGNGQHIHNEVENILCVACTDQEHVFVYLK